MPLLPVIAIGAAFLMIGKGLESTGEAVNEASNGAVKLAVAGAVAGGGYLILKKQGVI